MTSLSSSSPSLAHSLTLRFMVVTLVIVISLSPASAIPLRETAPWTLLLCKLKDNNYEPRSLAWFKEWFNNDSREGTVTHFFRDVSNGMYTVYTAETYGWFQVPFSKAEVRRLAIADEALREIQDIDRKTALKTKELCTIFARFFYGITLSSRVITFTNSQSIALFCRQRGILISTSYFMTSALTHEMCHSFHIGHSFSNRNIKVYPHAEVGEYDDLYDLMSTSNAFSYWSPYGSTGPGLNGPHLDYLGWLPANRILFFNAAQSSRPQTFRLASLSYAHHHTKDWLLILIPYDRDDPQKVFTLELRSKTGQDRAIPRSSVLIHQIEQNDEYYYSKLLTQSKGKYFNLKQGESWMVINTDMNYTFIYVRVNWINEWKKQAEITVFTNFLPTSCGTNEQHRLLFGPNDKVCINATEQRIVSIIRQEQPIRKLNRERCSGGYTRYALSVDDVVCVTDEENLMLMNQDWRWRQYQSFYYLDTYGLNMCVRGYVWRQIDSYDYVCVSRTRKAEVDQQNAMADQRRRSDGECVAGYVTRNAFPGDFVCVTPSEKQQASEDNVLNELRLRYFKFFNGIDEVSYNSKVYPGTLASSAAKRR